MNYSILGKIGGLICGFGTMNLALDKSGTLMVIVGIILLGIWLYHEKDNIL